MDIDCSLQKTDKEMKNKTQLLCNHVEIRIYHVRATDSSTLFTIAR